MIDYTLSQISRGVPQEPQVKLLFHPYLQAFREVRVLRQVLVGDQVLVRHQVLAGHQEHQD